MNWGDILSSQTVVLIGFLCTLVGVIVGILTYNRNRDKDVKGDAYKNAVITTKLDNINQSVNSIVIDLKTSERRLNDTDKTVAIIDQSVKSAHKRLDALENERGN